MRYKLLIFLFLSSCVSAEDLNYTFSFALTDFFGDCDKEKLDDGEVREVLYCTASFLNPSIPNPLMIFEPLNGLNEFNPITLISDFIVSITRLDFGGVFKSIESMLYTPVGLLKILFYLILSGIKWLILSAFKLFFVYLFYVCLAFQVLLMRLNINRRLEHEERVQTTLFIVLIASIITLSGVF